MLLATRTLIASVAMIGAGAVLLVGCASSVVPPTPSPASSIKESLRMLPPVIVIPGQTKVIARVGDVVVINSDAPTEDVVTTDRPDLLKVSQGSYDGSAWFNPGALALGEGSATLTVVRAGESRSIHVTISPAAR